MDKTVSGTLTRERERERGGGGGGEGGRGGRRGKLKGDWRQGGGQIVNGRLTTRTCQRRAGSRGH